MVSAKKFYHKRIWIAIITAVLIFFTVSLAVTKIVYDSIFARYDVPTLIPKTLSGMVQAREVSRFYSGENLLTGYHYHPKDPKKANGLIVLVPGFNAGGDDYLWQISEFIKHDWGVFAFDATGTLRSQGKNQVGFSQTVLDLEAALKHIKTNQLFGYNELVLIGHSRGAYAACCVLNKEHDVSAVVSISGVNSAMEATMHAALDAVGPVSYGNYGFLWLYQTMLFGSDTLERKASEEITKSDVPVLVIHGTKDENVPAYSGAIISYRDSIASSKVEYLFYPKGHTDILYDDDGAANNSLIDNIHEFLLRGLKSK